MKFILFMSVFWSIKLLLNNYFSIAFLWCSVCMLFVCLCIRFLSEVYNLLIFFQFFFTTQNVLRWNLLKIIWSLFPFAVNRRLFLSSMPKSQLTSVQFAHSANILLNFISNLNVLKTKIFNWINVLHISLITCFPPNVFYSWVVSNNLKLLLNVQINIKLPCGINIETQ